MTKNLYVKIYEFGGEILTQRVDFVTAALIQQAAKLQGKMAEIGTWTRSTGQVWTDRFSRREVTIAKIAPGGQVVMALVPFGLPITLASGETVQFEAENPPVVPQGIVEHPDFIPPNVPHGSAELPDA